MQIGKCAEATACGADGAPARGQYRADASRQHNAAVGALSGRWGAPQASAPVGGTVTSCISGRTRPNRERRLQETPDRLPTQN